MPEQQERTEQQSQRRKREGREKGDIPKSRELSAAIVLLIGLFALKFFGGSILTGTTDTFRLLWNPTVWRSDGLLTGIIPQMIAKSIVMLFPLMAVLISTAAMVAFAQVGGVFAVKAIAPDLNRIDPAKGLSRIFSKSGLMEMIKSLLKVAAIGWISYSTINSRIRSFPDLGAESPIGIAAYAFDSVFGLALKVTIFLLLIATMDYGYQRWQHSQNLRMTFEELKRERKEEEGDPLLKSVIRERQFEVARRRMMENVPKADVVVTNPTHIAVAIGVKPEPIVLAKGADLIAEKIKQIARENDVPIFENPPLARAIFEAADVGDLVPSELYYALAQIIYQVYQMKGITIEV